MKYTVKDINGEEHGPLSENEIEQLVDADMLTEAEPVKRHMMKNWEPAGELKFLKEAFKRAAKRKAERDGVKIVETPDGKITSVSHFENEYVPVPGGVFLRTYAFLYDIGMVAILAMILLLAGTLAALVDTTISTDSASAEVLKVKNDRAKLVKEIEDYEKEISELKGESSDDEGAATDGKQEKAQAGSIKAIHQASAERERAADKDFTKGSSTEISFSMESPPATNKPKQTAPVVNAFLAAQAEQLRVKKLATRQKRLAELKMEYNTPEVTPEMKPVERTGKPCTVSDTRAGFVTGDIWTDSVTGTKYICVYDKEEAARWCSLSTLTIVAYILLGIFIMYIIIYPAVSLGLYACTKGMRFYGLFVSDKESTHNEVLSFRAFGFYLLSLATLLLIPFFLLAGQRSPAELATGTRMIRTAAKK